MSQTELKPPKYPGLDKVCAYCQHYCFREGNPEWGQAYCLHYKSCFPKQGLKEHEPAGERTCHHWERKTRFGDE